MSADQSTGRERHSRIAKMNAEPGGYTVDRTVQDEDIVATATVAHGTVAQAAQRPVRNVDEIINRGAQLVTALMSTIITTYRSATSAVPPSRSSFDPHYDAIPVAIDDSGRCWYVALHRCLGATRTTLIDIIAGAALSAATESADVVKQIGFYNPNNWTAQQCVDYFLDESPFSSGRDAGNTEMRLMSFAFGGRLQFDLYTDDSKRDRTDANATVLNTIRVRLPDREAEGGANASKPTAAAAAAAGTGSAATIDNSTASNDEDVIIITMHGCNAEEQARRIKDNDPEWEDSASTSSSSSSSSSSSGHADHQSMNHFNLVTFRAIGSGSGGAAKVKLSNLVVNNESDERKQERMEKVQKMIQERGAEKA